MVKKLKQIIKESGTTTATVYIILSASSFTTCRAFSFSNIRTSLNE